MQPKANRVFKFKQFQVNDSRCPMKLTSDSVILGAWASFTRAKNVLDIGTGCGILALMAAQRSNALIQAIEIDADSAAQASENVAQSSWANRINVVNIDIKVYSRNNKSHFDVIVCNPPYFINSKPSLTRGKAIAKHDVELKYEELAQIVSQMLDEEGNFYLIIPTINVNYLTEAISLNNMFVNQRLWIYPRVGMAENRVCLRIQKLKHINSDEYLVIRNLDNSYSDDYIKLTDDFYLNLREKQLY